MRAHLLPALPRVIPQAQTQLLPLQITPNLLTVQTLTPHLRNTPNGDHPLAQPRRNGAVQ
jgi:hypothetical protein